MDLRDYLTMLRRGALIIAATTVLAGLAGLFYLQVTPKTYQATSAILLSPRNATGIGELQLGGQYAQSVGATAAELIGSPAVLEPTSRDLADAGTPVPENFLESAVIASRAESSAVITIGVVAPDPQLAADIADAVAERSVVAIPMLVSSRPSSPTTLLTGDVVRPAVVPSGPVAPAAQRVMVLFVAVGLALGLAITLLRQSLDNRIRRSSDITGMTQVPLLATLAKERRGSRTSIVVRDDPHGTAVEGYRVLRTNLAALGPSKGRSVLLTAVAGGPPTAQVSANLAWSLAQAERRVLLVDLDLRHSAIATLVDVPSAPGASDVLSDGTPLLEMVRGTPLPLLDVLPGGESERAPSDLLSGTGLESMVRAAEATYDYVIVHAPALLSHVDAAVVAGVVGQTVVVVRAGRTREPDLTRAMGVLANVGVSPLGIVLSGARSSVADNVRPRTGSPADARRSAGRRSATGPS